MTYLELHDTLTKAWKLAFELGRLDICSQLTQAKLDLAAEIRAEEDRAMREHLRLHIDQQQVTDERQNGPHDPGDYCE